MKKILSLEIENNRIFGLDLLRCLAIIFVFLTHNEPLLPKEYARIIQLFYFDGVSVFFVLSGFLIGFIFIKIFEKHGSNLKQLKNFWIRRWFRTLPTYYLYVFIISILSKVLIKGFSLKITLPYFIFSQNLFKNTPGFFGESWSLTIEEWFYLVIPFLVVFSTQLLKIPIKKTLIFIIVFFMVFSPVIRYTMYEKNLLPPGFYQILIYRTDSIMYGVLGAYIAYYYQAWWNKFQKPIFYMGILLFIIWKIISDFYSSSFFYANFSFPLFSFATLCVIPLLSNFKIKNYKLLHKIITYVSLISYSLYLVHYSLVKKLIIDIVLLPEIAELNVVLIYFIKNSVYWVASFAIAFFSYKYFEIPTTKLRNKF